MDVDFNTLVSGDLPGPVVQLQISSLIGRCPATQTIAALYGLLRLFETTYNTVTATKSGEMPLARRILPRQEAAIEN